MMEQQTIDVRGMTFEVTVAGEVGAPVVLCLHGFPQNAHSWREQLPVLAEVGYLAVAPNQRGYSPGARPGDRSAYETDELLDDALAIARHFGGEVFHVVGHDWGGQLSWLLAANHGDRVRTLSVLSRPHPAAFARAMAQDNKQASRSGHHRTFQEDDAAQKVLADNAARMRATLADQGVPAQDIDAYLTPLSTVAAMDAAINWYRGAPGSASALQGAEVPAVRCPTLYLWGDVDATVGRMAAELTAEYVDGPYDFQVIEGVGHFITDQNSQAVNQALIHHLRKWEETT